jgi:prolyl 4-hydroxylase
MIFKNVFTWIIQIIIVLILTIIFYEIYNYFKKPPKYKGRGYCSIDSEYIHPKIHTNFITQSENDYILEKSSSLFSNSQLVSKIVQDVRKSYTAWLSKDDPIVSNIIKRVCDLSNIPFENSEKMQVVKYEPGGYYNEHYDASCDDLIECVEFEKNGGQRVVTMIIYLNDQYEGGSTNFPRLNNNYKPVKNTGVLFYSLEKNGSKCHPLSLHAGAQVLSGHKYIANIWLRETKYDVNK